MINNQPEYLPKSINQSIDVFQGKAQTVQFTNIYKRILFFTWCTRDNHNSEGFHSMLAAYAILVPTLYKKEEVRLHGFW